MTAPADVRRPGAEADAVGGVVPGEVARPASADEVAGLLRAAAADGRTVVPVGGRSKLGWAAPPESCDLVLDLTGLDRVVEHVAGDLTVVAEAGVRLADLQAGLGESGQQLLLLVLADQRFEDVLRQRVVRRQVVVMRIDGGRLGGERDAQRLRAGRRCGQAGDGDGGGKQECAHDDGCSRLKPF